MSKKHKQRGSVHRDLIAKDLLTNPLYRMKVIPNKKKKYKRVKITANNYEKVSGFYLV